MDTIIVVNLHIYITHPTNWLFFLKSISTCLYITILDVISLLFLRTMKSSSSQGCQVRVFYGKYPDILETPERVGGEFVQTWILFFATCERFLVLRGSGGAFFTSRSWYQPESIQKLKYMYIRNQLSYSFLCYFGIPIFSQIFFEKNAIKKRGRKWQHLNSAR